MKKKRYITISLIIVILIALVTAGYNYRNSIEGNITKLLGKTQKQEEVKLEEKEFKVEKINKIEVETYIPEDEAEMIKKTNEKIAESDIYYNGVKNVFLLINDEMDKKHELFEVLNKVENKKELLEKIEKHLKENYNGSPYPFKCTEIKIYEYMGEFEIIYASNKSVMEKYGNYLRLKRKEYDVIFTYKKLREKQIPMHEDPLGEKIDKMSRSGKEVVE